MILTYKFGSSLKTNEDRFICRHLCSNSLVLESTGKKAFSSCDQICFEVTRSHASAGEICPFEKYCKDGCPCPFYQCEKVTNKQTLVPVFELKKKKNIKGKLMNDHYLGQIEYFVNFSKFPIFLIFLSV